MATELACGSKLAQLMSNHVFSNVNRNKLISVVNGYRMTYEVGRNHRGARPCLYDILLATFIHRKDFLFQTNLDIRTFL